MTQRVNERFMTRKELFVWLSNNSGKSAESKVCEVGCRDCIVRHPEGCIPYVLFSASRFTYFDYETKNK